MPEHPFAWYNNNYDEANQVVSFAEDDDTHSYELAEVSTEELWYSRRDLMVMHEQLVRHLRGKKAGESYLERFTEEVRQQRRDVILRTQRALHETTSLSELALRLREITEPCQRLAQARARRDHEEVRQESPTAFHEGAPRFEWEEQLVKPKLSLLTQVDAIVADNKEDRDDENDSLSSQSLRKTCCEPKTYKDNTRCLLRSRLQRQTARRSLLQPKSADVDSSSSTIVNSIAFASPEASLLSKQTGWNTATPSHAHRRSPLRQRLR